MKREKAMMKATKESTAKALVARSIIDWKEV
jgi:hypothetical protein